MDHEINIGIPGFQLPEIHVARQLINSTELQTDSCYVLEIQIEIQNQIKHKKDDGNVKSWNFLCKWFKLEKNTETSVFAEVRTKTTKKWTTFSNDSNCGVLCCEK